MDPVLIILVDLLVREHNYKFCRTYALSVANPLDLTPRRIKLAIKNQIGAWALQSILLIF